jgi:CBS domain containing-hemolysin-like protein
VNLTCYVAECRWLVPDAAWSNSSASCCQSRLRLVFGELQHLPNTGEVVVAHGRLSEVMDLDARRNDKVLATRIEPQTEAE